MRAFVGVPLPPEPSLLGLLDALRGSGADLKVVDGHHFHLTLVFLDEIQPPTGDALLAAIRAQDLPHPFDVTLRDVGAFPNWNKVNVLWAGVDDASGGLAKAYVACERSWVGLGHVSEGRAFRPHLTLARARGERGIAAARDVLGAYRNRVFGTARVDRINLYRSTLTAQGPVYDVLGDVAL